MDLSTLSRIFRRLLPLVALIAAFSLMTTTETTRAAEPQNEPQIAFQQSLVTGITGMGNPTTLQFGPDGRLYVAERYGTIFALDIERNGPANYSVTAQENIDLIWQDISNRTDTGVIDTSSGFVQNNRQVTGLVVTGTATNPVIYVSSSDPREGGGGAGTDTNLDTNSGVVSRLTWNGTSWDHLQLVRGLPRSEENHAVNGMALDETTNTLYVAVGGFTNMGAPSFNFTYIPEYAYAAAIVSVDLDMIGNTQYDMPTLDDPTRANNPDGSDINDPWGGNDGLNQARIDPTGPVQIYASGFRNPYDVVLTEQGQMYTIDNGPNYNWGGPPVNEALGQCDDTINENNSETHYDNLHLITGQGFYGGHPAPVRANPAGIYANEADSPVPFALANPVECDYREPGVDDGALATWVTSTNGMTEYTATNFFGAMQGDLLAVSYDGGVYRMKPTSDGSGLVDLTPNDTGDWGYQQLFTGFGIVPLDVTAQGDNDVFPGTIWVAVFVDKTIAVFEPIDFPCSGNYDATIDEDGDGFDNADELDNSTNPCSNGSKPADNDGDFTSDLNDPDDDNDGIADVVDAFQIDPQNGVQSTLPLRYDFFQDAPGTGFFGVGFTGLMANGTTDYLDMFFEADLTVGGTAGKATVDQFTEGTAFGLANTQDYAFQWGVNVDANTGQFGINAQMNNPFFSPSPEAGDEQGIYFGTGDQSDYFQIALTADDPGGAIGFEVIVENNDVPSRTFYAAAGANTATKVNLYLSIDPANATVQPKYSLDGTPYVNLGTPITLTGALYNVVNTPQVMAVGLIANFNSGSTPFGGTWDYVFVETEQPGVLGANPTPVNYGDVVQGTFVDQTVTLQNLGKMGDPSINISDLALSGNVDFTIVGDPTPVDLAPGTTVDVVVRYQPAEITADTATLTVTHDGLNSPLNVTLNGNAIVDYDPIYRVNIGGAELADPENILNWSADDGVNPSPYANHAASGSTLTSTGAVIDMTNPTLPAYTPTTLFNSGRWDPANGASNAMQYEFPVTNGRYEVRLYFAETFSGTASVGARVWDAELEGGVPTALDDIDRYALAGFNTGYMLAAETDVTDGALTVRFLHQVENPELQGIEVYPVFVPPTSDLGLSSALLDFGAVNVGTGTNQVLTLTNLGTSADPAISISGLSYSGADASAFSDDFVASVVLQPGESTDVTVTLNASQGGSAAATLTINHDGGNAPTDVNLTATAYESGKLALAPDPLAFGQVETDSFVTLPLTLSNLGAPTDPDIEVTNLVVTGTNTYQFQFAAYGEPLIIPAGQSVDVDVTFTPAQVGTNNVTISAAHNGVNSPVNIAATGEGIEPINTTGSLYRVNVGGGTVTDPAGILDWEADNGTTPSPYLIAGGSAFSSTGSMINTSHPSLPANTPMSIFQTERWDPNDGAATMMTYEFPVTNGTYEVRLYIAEIYGGIGGANQRVFDATIEGSIPAAFDDIDPYALSGFEAGYMVAAQADVTDGALTVLLQHVIENPALKAIEIVGVGEVTPTSELIANPVSYDFGSTDITVPDVYAIELVNNGAVGAPAIDITEITFGGSTAFSTDFTAPLTLQAGDSTTVNVTFNPSDTVSYNATMTVAHNGDNAALDIPLSGFGSTPGLLSMDVTVLDFGTVVINNTATANINLTNRGSTGDPTITISELNLNGPESADFSHAETLPLTIQAGATATVELTFAPLTAGAKSAEIVIINDGTQGTLTVPLAGVAEEPASGGETLYRVNVGGSVVSDPAGILDWEADNSGSPSPYRLAGNANYAATNDTIDMSSPTIPENTPQNIFKTERWDPSNGDAMSYAFPVPAGTYQVRLYLAELYGGITTPGQRVFDATVEGVLSPAFTDIDMFAAVGFKAGYVVSAEYEVTDGNLTLEFSHQVENPAIKAIEIVAFDTTPPATLSILPDGYNFGPVNKDAQATEQLMLTHTGALDASAITINSIDLSNPTFTTDFSIPVTLQPGESAAISVSFAPDSVGTEETVLTVIHSGDNSPASTTLTGVGIAPNLTATPLTHDFGTVDTSLSVDQVITLANDGVAGDSAIDITALTFNGVGASDFSSDFVAPLTLQAGESVAVTVTFAPTSVANYDVTMSVTHDGTNNPLDVPFIGAGFADVAILEITPASFDFGNTDVDNLAVQAITLAHTGSASTPAITISDVTFDDVAFSSDFASAIVLAPGESTTLNVTFDPADLTAYSATMTVTHDGNNAPTSSTLTGSGSAPGDLAQDVSALDFGSVTINSSATADVTVTNLGSTGDPAITISDLQFSGVDAADFGHSMTLPLVIEANTSAVIDLTFAPTTAGMKSAQVSIIHDGDTSPAVLDLTGEALDLPAYGDPIYRINAGGSTLTDPAGILDWSSDGGGGSSAYRIAGGNGLSGATGVAVTDPSIPENTPAVLFTTERWDPNDGTANEMAYEFPVTNGTYLVRLYLAETFGGITGAGQRVFDVALEGTVPPEFDDIDQFAQVGAMSGFTLSAEVDVSDSNLTVRMLRAVENPAIKGIEIIPVNGGTAAPDAILTADPAPFDFGSVDVNNTATQAFTLSNTGEAGAPSLTIADITFGDAAFTSDFSAPVVLGTGESAIVNVTFAPLEPGTYTADMTIDHDGANAPDVIGLTGASADPNRLLSDADVLTFGSLAINSETGTASITLSNAGDTGDPTITVSGLSLSGTDAAMFSSDTVLPLSLAPGETATVSVTFAPTTVGNKSATLTIVNDGKQGDLTVALAGTGIESDPTTSSAIIRIETGGDPLTSSTYNPSFYVENTSVGGQEIVSVSFDISSALVPDVVFDPLGQAGDSGGRCLFPDGNTATATGFIVPADPCVDPFFAPYELGYHGITATFNDFQTGEDFLFGVDIDPISTRGTNPPGPDDVASVSGYELIGTIATITFSDGTTHSTPLWRYNTSITGSYNIARTHSLSAPSIEVIGVGTQNADVTDAAQIVRVTGPVGQTVSLLVSEGEMVEQAGGGYDVDPYEINTVLNVAEYSVTISAAGTVDIPITLLDDALIDGTYGGKNLLMAVIRSEGITSPISNRIVLEVSDPAPALTFAGDLIFNAQEGQSITVSDSVVSGTDDASTPTINLSAVDDATGLAATWLTVPNSTVAGTAVTVDVDVIGLTPGTYTATITGTASGYTDASFSVSVTVNDLTVTITAPTDGMTITGDSFDVSWISSGGLIDDHIHLTLDDLATTEVEPHVGSLAQNDTFSFTGVAPGNYAIIVQMANVNHIVYDGVSTAITVTVEAPSTQTSMSLIYPAPYIVTEPVKVTLYGVQDPATQTPTIDCGNGTIINSASDDCTYLTDGTYTITGSVNNGTTQETFTENVTILSISHAIAMVETQVNDPMTAGAFSTSTATQLSSDLASARTLYDGGDKANARTLLENVRADVEAMIAAGQVAQTEGQQVIGLIDRILLAMLNS